MFFFDPIDSYSTGPLLGLLNAKACLRCGPRSCCWVVATVVVTRPLATTAFLAKGFRKQVLPSTLTLPMAAIYNARR